MTHDDEPWTLRRARLAAEMAARKLHLHIEPKRANRVSGPQRVEDCLGDACQVCRERIVIGSGKLRDGKCGRCARADDAPAA
jgi:hypothetical protein